MFLLSVESAPFEWVGLKCGSGHRRAGEDTRPYGVSGNAYRGRSQTGRGRPHGAAPTVENGTGALARKRQARERNRTSSNFPPTQAPSGAGRDRTQALLILRAGRILPTSRGNPRNRGPGKGDYEHEVLIWSRPRGRFGSFAAMGKGTRRPQAAKSPCKRQTVTKVRLEKSKAAKRSFAQSSFAYFSFKKSRSTDPRC